MEPAKPELSLSAVETLQKRAASENLLRFCREKPLGAIGGILILLLVLTAIFAETLVTHDPIRTDAEHTLSRPTRAHWLGTDNLGRDIYSRIVYGARVSLMVG